MITYIHNEAKQIGNETYIWFIGNCLSTDYKPTELVYDNSKLFETDTLKNYVYSAADHTWNEVSGNGVLIVNVVAFKDDDNNILYELDKTFREIMDAPYYVIKYVIKNPDGSINGIGYPTIVGIQFLPNDRYILMASFDGDAMSFGPGGADDYPVGQIDHGH